jgi:RNA polymerase sigma-70 factor (ECF subfamily)
MSDASLDDEFARVTSQHRRELLAHCYRMSGSVHEAEDLVQETYLRAWRAYDKFEGRSSVRTWLYRIATNTCLTELEGRARRPLPTGLGGPSDHPEGDLAERSEVLWLEPVPDALVMPERGDPADVVAAKETVRLALVTTLQHLPPRQRAVLVLRDVLRFSAAEVAELLDTTPAAVNSLLQRARAELAEVDGDPESASLPTDAQQREMLDRWAKAFEAYDVDAITALLTDDAVWEMPPFAAWFRGANAIGRLIRSACPAEAAGDQVMVPLLANGQPGFALYMRDPVTRAHRAFQIQVLTLTAAGVVHAVAFFDLTLFDVFGLPQLLSDLRDAQPQPVYVDAGAQLDE